MALDVARTEGTVEVTALLSTVNADADRVADLVGAANARRVYRLDTP